ncbi:endospore germination permease [Paenibacillus sepulcri]|uniref:Spore germination protein n=1 Tax=Paenibacillus sepulcri TaxID=359917 RepID=A0ABS7C3W2_9BACL|nr:spore germination protein [Paenibacillus sepulcri]
MKLMKLSGSQIFWIVATVEVVIAVMLRISPSIEISNQDAWLSILVAGVLGVALTFLFVHLSLLHPNKTLTEFSQALLGKWFGRLIVLPYFITWYLLSADVLRLFTDFIHLTLLDKTPVWLIMTFMIVLMTYLTYTGGITGIGRFCEIAGPITFLTLVLSFLLNAENVEWNHLLPMYSDSGAANIINGAFAPASFFAESLMLMVILAFTHNPKKAFSRSILGVSITALMVLISTIMVLLVFGPNVAAKLRFPFFMLVRSINILDFIQNVDIFVIFIWIFGVFVKLSLYLFITSYEIANLFNVKDWRKFIWFGAPAIFITAIVLFPNETKVTFFQTYWEFGVIPVCGIAIPLLLWIITVVKRKSVKI